MLGRDLAALAPETIELIPLTHAEVDVTDFAAVERTIRDVHPQVVVNATGYTQVDRAESEAHQAYAVNAEALVGLAAQCARVGVLLVHFSTDYVFDGRGTRPYLEDDPIGPINLYGKSKWAGEVAVRTGGTRFLLLRTSWLFGPGGRSFPRTMADRARARQATKVVNDQLGRPTYTPDLARATWRAIEQGLTGTFHAANEGEATWYDIARHIFERAGAVDLLRPCTTAEYPTPARRPAYSVLDTGRLATAGIRLPEWTDALERFLALSD